MINMFDDPLIEKKVLQTCSCFLLELKSTVWIGIEQRGNQRQHSINKKKIKTS